jgi:phenylpyruvate tautomerase PptA (4-oxalocrotonate tautomerase family)
MPIVDVELVLETGKPRREFDVNDLANVIGGAFDSPAGSTWVRLRYLPAAQYGENGDEMAEFAPVFVGVLKACVGDLAEREREAQALTGAVARALDRPESCIHVVYEPEGAGRVAFGGAMVKA